MSGATSRAAQTPQARRGNARRSRYRKCAARQTLPFERALAPRPRSALPRRALTTVRDEANFKSELPLHGARPCLAEDARDGNGIRSFWASATCASMACGLCWQPATSRAAVTRDRSTWIKELIIPHINASKARSTVQDDLAFKALPQCRPASAPAGAGLWT
jgi:hypothetical protein